MPHNALVRGGVGSGGWTNYAVLHAVMEQVDQYCFQSINGDLGGTWAPSSVITIGGSGLTVTGQFTANGVVTVGGVATFTSNVTLQAGATVWNTLLIDGSHTGQSTLNASALLLGNAGSTLTWHGAATFDTGALTIGNGASVTAGLFQIQAPAAKPTFFTGLSLADAVASFDCSGPANFSGAVQVSNVVMSFTGSGHARYRRIVGFSGDHTYTIADGDYIFVPIGGLPGNQQYTFQNTGSTGGEVVTVTNADSGSHSLTLKQHNGSTTIAVLTGANQKATIINNGSGLVNGGWDLLSLSG